MSKEKSDKINSISKDQSDSTVGYKISISKNRKYLLIDIMTEITIDIVRRWTTELKELSIKHNIKRYLFDTRGTSNAVTTTESYKFAYQEMNDLRLSRTDRSAILVSPGDTSHNFIETLSKNAGFSVKVFTDEKLAVKWLEE